MLFCLVFTVVVLRIKLLLVPLIHGSEIVFMHGCVCQAFECNILLDSIAFASLRSFLFQP